MLKQLNIYCILLLSFFFYVPLHSEVITLNEELISIEDIQKKKDGYQKDKEVLQTKVENPSKIIEIREGLERIINLLVQQRDLRIGIENNKTQLATQKEEIAKSEFEDDPSGEVIFASYESSYIQFENEKKNLELLQTALDQKEKELKLLRKAFDKSYGKYTLLAEKNDPFNHKVLSKRYQTLLIKEEFYRTFLQRKNVEISFQIQRVQKQQSEEKYNRLYSKVQFSENYLKEILDKLQKTNKKLDRKKKYAQKKLSTNRSLLLTLQEKILQNRQKQKELNEKESAISDIVNSLQEDIILYGKLIHLKQEKSEFWSKRYAFFHKELKLKSVKDLRDVVEDSLRNLKIEEELEASILKNDQRRYDNVFSGKEKRETFRSLFEQQGVELKSNIRLRKRYISEIENDILFLKRFLAEIDKQRDDFQLRENLIYLYDIIIEIFDYPLIKIGESTHLNLKKIFLFILFLGFGVSIVKRTSKYSIALLKKWLHFEDSIENTLQTLSYYFLLFILIIIALDFVNIPMTAFAFLGGAVAIGFGFGSQNILNNFISGIILLLERPVKVGDIIETENELGTIMRIGMRCTQILTFENIDLLIPNSKLLENKLTNLTLDNQVIRVMVTVGVSYSSDPRKVSQIINRILHEHGQIEKKPEPFVIFEDFGSSSLDFKAYFYVKISSHGNLLQIKSDVRHMIFQQLKNAGISIPFPQRDLNWSAKDPVEIKILREKNEERPDSKKSEIALE